MNSHDKPATDLVQFLPFFKSEIDDVEETKTFPVWKQNYLNEFKVFCRDNVSLLHLNVQSLFGKIDDLKEILNLSCFDIVCINETFFNNSIPFSFHINCKYNFLRYDRVGKSGGGLLVFIKKQYKIFNIKQNSDIECIQYSIMIDKMSLNFISCYKAPDIDNQLFLDKLEEVLLELDNDLPLFIIGDLNMDLLNNKQNDLSSFIINNSLSNFVNAPTRTQIRFFEKENRISCSSTLIDVILGNNDLIENSKVVQCPFSDHDFVLAKLNLKSNVSTCDYFYTRKIDEVKIHQISNQYLPLYISKDTFMQ